MSFTTVAWGLPGDVGDAEGLQRAVTPLKATFAVALARKAHTAIRAVCRAARHSVRQAGGSAKLQRCQLCKVGRGCTKFAAPASLASATTGDTLPMAGATSWTLSRRRTVHTLPTTNAGTMGPSGFVRYCIRDGRFGKRTSSESVRVVGGGMSGRRCIQRQPGCGNGCRCGCHHFSAVAWYNARATSRTRIGTC
jgi:hypothetical protein